MENEIVDYVIEIHERVLVVYMEDWALPSGETKERNAGSDAQRELHEEGGFADAGFTNEDIDGFLLDHILDDGAFGRRYKRFNLGMSSVCGTHYFLSSHFATGQRSAKSLRPAAKEQG